MEIKPHTMRKGHSNPRSSMEAEGIECSIPRLDGSRRPLRQASAAAATDLDCARSRYECLRRNLLPSSCVAASGYDCKKLSLNEAPSAQSLRGAQVGLYAPSVLQIWISSLQGRQFHTGPHWVARNWCFLFGC